MTWKLLLLPILAIAALAATLVVVAWNVELGQRQDQVVNTIVIVGGASLLLALWVPLWLVAFSGARPRVRLWGLAGYLALLGAARLLLVPAGYSGDVVPAIRWRWARPAGEIAVEPVGTSSGGRRLSSAEDWPGFLGPRRDGSAANVILARDWASQPPRLAWRRPVGAAWSSFAVSGEFAVTQEQRGGQELVTAYDLEDGEPIWWHAEQTRFEDAIGGPGPRATPSIASGRVFAMGGTGRLVALELASGKLLWSRQVLVDHRASAPTYGMAASPLVVGERVVVAAGGPDGHSLAAYDVATGEPAWSGGEATAAYSSPMWVELAGVPQIVLFGGTGLAAHDPASGTVLWTAPWPPVEKVSQPVWLPPDRLFVSSGYGAGAKLFEIARSEAGGFEARVLWESLALKAKFTNVVARGGYLYGLDDGILACVAVSDGTRRWKGGRYGHGQTLLVQDLLVVVGENGRVALVEASPVAWVELGSFAALDGKTWNHPALAGRRLIVRNDREAACFELPPDMTFAD